MKRFYLIAVILTLISCGSNPIQKMQKDLLDKSTRKIKVLPFQMEVDKLGNVYIINHLGQLQVYNSQGLKKYEYADKRLGKITSFDVSNPMNLLIYFKEQGVVKILDNTLTEIKAINFLVSGKFSNIGAVCLANDNNIWLYDAQYQKIVKVDGNLNTIAETNRFSDLGKISFIPNKMIERNNRLVVSNENEGFLMFDNFGQLLNYFEIPRVKDFQFDGYNIIIQTPTGMKNQAIGYPSFTMIGLPIGIASDKIKNAKTENKKWYVSYEDGVDVYDR